MGRNASAPGPSARPCFLLTDTPTLVALVTPTFGRLPRTARWWPPEGVATLAVSGRSVVAASSRVKSERRQCVCHVSVFVPRRCMHRMGSLQESTLEHWIKRGGQLGGIAIGSLWVSSKRPFCFCAHGIQHTAPRRSAHRRVERWTVRTGSMVLIHYGSASAWWARPIHTHTYTYETQLLLSSLLLYPGIYSW